MAKESFSFAELKTSGKVFLLVFIVGVISAGYYFLMHMSVADEIEATRAQHQKLLADLETAKKKHAEYVRLANELADRQGLDRRLKRILPEDAEIPGFLRDLNRVAELSGLNISLVDPRPEQRQQHFTKIPVDVRVKGRFHQMARFFDNVSRLERAINMENIALKLGGRTSSRSNTTEDEGVQLEVAVQATTFRRPESGGMKRGAK